MTTYSAEEVEDLTVYDFSTRGGISIDSDGQVVIYTGIYRYEDGTYHDKPENQDDYR